MLDIVFLYVGGPLAVRLLSSEYQNPRFWYWYCSKFSSRIWDRGYLPPDTSLRIKGLAVDELALVEPREDEDMLLFNLAEGFERIYRSSAHRKIWVAVRIRRRASGKELLLHVLKVQPRRAPVLGKEMEAGFSLFDGILRSLLQFARRVFDVLDLEIKLLLLLVWVLSVTRRGVRFLELGRLIYKLGRYWGLLYRGLYWVLLWFEGARLYFPLAGEILSIICFLPRSLCSFCLPWASLRFRVSQIEVNGLRIASHLIMTVSFL